LAITLEDSKKLKAKNWLANFPPNTLPFPFFNGSEKKIL